MSHLGEAVRRGHRLGPALDGIPGHLDGQAARPAHDVVVVVLGGARPVDGLALGGADDVDLTVGGHRLEVAVDGREADRGARPARAAWISWAERNSAEPVRAWAMAARCRVGRRSPESWSVIGTPPPRADRARRSAPRGRRAGARRAGSRRGRRARPWGARSRGRARGRAARSGRGRRGGPGPPVPHRCSPRGRRPRPAARSSRPRASPRSTTPGPRPTLQATPMPTAHHSADRKLRANSRGGVGQDHQRADEQQPDDPHRHHHGHRGEHREHDVVAEHRHPEGAGVLLVVGHGEEARAQHQRGGEDHGREHREHDDVAGGRGEDGPEQVGQRGGRAGARPGDEDDAQAMPP